MERSISRILTVIYSWIIIIFFFVIQSTFPLPADINAMIEICLIVMGISLAYIILKDMEIGKR